MGTSTPRLWTFAALALSACAEGNTPDIPELGAFDAVVFPPDRSVTNDLGPERADDLGAPSDVPEAMDAPDPTEVAEPTEISEPTDVRDVDAGRDAPVVPDVPAVMDVPPLTCDMIPGHVCDPAQRRGCGRCGSQTCRSDCTWGACTGEGVCAPGSTQPGGCDACSVQTCSNTCVWGGCALRAGAACEFRGGTNHRTCSACRCGLQWCLNTCRWSTACTSCCSTCGGCL